MKVPIEFVFRTIREYERCINDIQKLIPNNRSKALRAITNASIVRYSRIIEKYHNKDDVDFYFKYTYYVINKLKEEDNE